MEIETHQDRLDVTAALIVEQDRVLVTLRPDRGFWEFPGGKRHLGESLPDCLAREIEEELGLQVAVLSRFMTVDRDGDTPFRLHAFFCRIESGAPQTLGVADWAWSRLEDLVPERFLPADREIIQALQIGAARLREAAKGTA